MVENSGIEKSGIEMSCNLLESGHFTPRLLNPRLSNPIVVWGQSSCLKILGLISLGMKLGVEKSGVGMSCNLQKILFL
jgi:hypothetical protein